MEIGLEKLKNSESFVCKNILEVPNISYLKFVDEIVENSLDSIIAIDAGGKICTWNHQAEATFGWTRVEVVGKPLIETVIPRTYCEAHIDGIKNFFLTGEGAVLNRRIEVSAVNRQGVELPVELFVMPVRFGNTILFYAFIRDISSVKLREMELKKLNEKLALSLHQRDEFLSIASHELKTPLTSLRLQIQLTDRQLRKLNTPEYGEENLERAMAMCYKQIDSLSNIVGDLLDISRVHAGRLVFNFAETDMTALIVEIVERFAESMDRAGCVLDLKLEPKVLGQWDRSRIEQVITNLLSNAVKYCAKSKVTVCLEKSQVDGRVKITVSDSGRGMDPKTLSGIFEPFFRADDQRQPGLGLGLYISRRIVEGHGGRIWAENKAVGGSDFHVELPIAPTVEAMAWRILND
ncbi:MAG: ATP-binding protein [Pseudomonadota bacterium]|nr:ATP-binding protein [Pseudomonadota bacterium]